MEVNDYEKDEHSRNEIGEVGQVASVEGLFQRSHFIRSRDHQMDKCDQSSLELGAYKLKWTNIQYMISTTNNFWIRCWGNINSYAW